MAIIESVGRLGATIIAMTQTRLELAAVEIEEESQRLLAYLMLGMLSLLLFGIALLLVALVIVLVFWDSYRIEAAIGMAVLFGAGGAYCAARLAGSIAAKPRLLGATMAELNKDLNFVRNAGAGDER
ncbi:MAG: phage holin family protein [Pseudomonadota bacterium]